MSIPTHVVLGAIAGVTIFLGLPVARWRAVSQRTHGILALAAAGVILFLVIEVGFQAMQRVEAAVLGGAAGLWSGVLLVGGFALGLVGLAWLEDHRRRRQTSGAEALEIAAMVAIGIGLHNFAEGLAIGQSFSSGSTSLATVLVVGFALHNATEGFGIAGPLAGQQVSWARLLAFGLIGGAPTALGSFVGGIWVNPSLELLFLALAAGSLVYVTRELLRIRFAQLPSAGAMAAVTLGLFLGFGTELVVDVGQSSLGRSSARAAATIRFADTNAEPVSVAITQGEALEIRNDGEDALVFEGNGLFVGEVAVPPAGSVTVVATGPVGEYRLADERGMSGTAEVLLTEGAAVDPLLAEKSAIGALTILEGHVRAAKELHDRAVRREGPHPEADLKRAPVHAGHPQKELLRGDQPDALALQAFLSRHGLLDELDAKLTDFVGNAGNANLDQGAFDESYQRTLDAVEDARRAIGNDAYDLPDFRRDVIRFVLVTAAGEYATAAQSGRIRVEVPGVPGQDDFIEYQDAREFVLAARELATPLIAELPVEAVQAFDSLQWNIFRTLDPPAPDAPIPPSAVRLVIRTATDE